VRVLRYATPASASVAKSAAVAVAKISGRTSRNRACPPVARQYPFSSDSPTEREKDGGPSGSRRDSCGPEPAISNTAGNGPCPGGIGERGREPHAAALTGRRSTSLFAVGIRLRGISAASAAPVPTHPWSLERQGKRVAGLRPSAVHRGEGFVDLTLECTRSAPNSSLIEEPFRVTVVTCIPFGVLVEAVQLLP